jgi:hypothetical protein
MATRESDIGVGTIKTRGKKRYYSGEIPFKEGERVFMISEGDMEKMLIKDMATLMVTGREMLPELYSRQKEGQNIAFADQIQFHFANQHKTYILDRTVYSPDFPNQLWVRYYTMDQALEEGEFNDEELKKAGLDVPKDKGGRNDKL